MTAPLIVLPAEATDVARIGGKAASLGRLVGLGFDVPAFFVLTPEAAGAIGAQDLGAQDLAAALTVLGPGPYAVRSSGRDEDGAAHSHAGQFLSLLQVPAEGVAEAIGRVRASGAGDGISGYRQAQGLSADGGAPAVIVQAMVDARAAGVAFSADPVYGRRDRVLISATAGLGDRLVGGEVDGADYVVEARSGGLVSRPAGGPLSDDDAIAVARLATCVAEAFGAPQDIEWAFEGPRLKLLQARAITTPLRPVPIEDKARTIFDNSNIVESYPGLVTPLTFSFAQYAYARVYRAFLGLCGIDAETARRHQSALDNMLGRIDGRVYYNLGNWYRLLALLPGFRLNRAHMETMMGVAEPLPAEIADALAPPPARGLAVAGEWLRIVRVVGRLGFEAVRLPRTIRQFYGRLDAALADDPAAIDGMSLSELAATYRRIEAELLDRWDAPLVNDFLCMIAFGASRKLAERWLGPAGLELHNDVLIGQGDIVSAEPPQRIARMGRLAARDPALVEALAAGDRSAVDRDPELAAEVAAYVAKFGDRCTEELKLESITLDVDPGPLFAAIAAAARQTDRSAPVRAEEGGLDRLGELMRGRPLRRVVLGALLRRAKARVRDRENLRFERTRIFGRARRVFLAIGRQFHALGLIEAPRDVLFLSVHEVLGAIEGFGHDRDLAGLVALRKRQFELDAGKPEAGERLAIDGAIAAHTSRHEAPTATVAQGAAPGGVLQGVGCSAGRVTARARVVHDPARQRVEPGEVLIARHTDPGWIALFANASAIVVERGSLLSHSAIVARELGIPCVVALKGAMTAIASGDLVEVDGATGAVRVIA